jgi:hypothetical protein
MTSADFELSPRLDREVSRLGAELRERRDCGHVLFELAEVRGRAPEVAVLDALAERVGGSPLGDDWITIDAEGAFRLLARVLARDLAMNAAIMPREHADGLARRFLALFGDGARYFTNSTILDEDDVESTWTGSWRPLTKATFDTGIAVVDGARAGLLWVTDED